MNPETTAKTSMAECRCQAIVPHHDLTAKIKYCPLHRAAPELVEALVIAQKMLNSVVVFPQSETSFRNAYVTPLDRERVVALRKQVAKALRQAGVKQ